MTILHVFIDTDKQETVMQGWEFPDVIVGGETYAKAEEQFKKFVGISLRAKILDMLKTLKNLPKDAPMSDNDKQITRILASYYEIVDSKLDTDTVAKASIDVARCLEMYVKLPSIKSEFSSVPSSAKKVVFA